MTREARLGRHPVRDEDRMIRPSSATLEGAGSQHVRRQQVEAQRGQGVMRPRPARTVSTSPAFRSAVAYCEALPAVILRTEGRCQTCQRYAGRR
jgi:hypothetical protein